MIKNCMNFNYINCLETNINKMELKILNNIAELTLYTVYDKERTVNN